MIKDSATTTSSDIVVQIPRPFPMESPDVVPEPCAKGGPRHARERREYCWESGSAPRLASSMHMQAPSAWSQILFHQGSLALHLSLICATAPDCLESLLAARGISWLHTAANVQHGSTPQSV